MVSINKLNLGFSFKVRSCLEAHHTEAAQQPKKKKTKYRKSFHHFQSSARVVIYSTSMLCTAPQHLSTSVYDTRLAFPAMNHSYIAIHAICICSDIDTGELHSGGSIGYESAVTF